MVRVNSLSEVWLHHIDSFIAKHTVRLVKYYWIIVYNKIKVSTSFLCEKKIVNITLYFRGNARCPVKFSDRIFFSTFSNRCTHCKTLIFWHLSNLIYVWNVVVCSGFALTIVPATTMWIILPYVPVWNLVLIEWRHAERTVVIRILFGHIPNIILVIIHWWLTHDSSALVSSIWIHMRDLVRFISADVIIIVSCC